MQNSLFEALFLGKINPFERKVEYTPERRELNKKIQDEKRYFIEKLSADDSKRFEELESLLTHKTLDTDVEVHSHGFALGILLVLECLTMRDRVINK